MAVYEYKCDEGHDVIIERGMTENEPDNLCCNQGECALPIRRVYSAPAIKFNGRGFFSNGG
jgi:predicted nucleic acid-binding Zn ribbon protein